MTDQVFVDTWGWVALGHSREARHQEIVDFYQDLRSRGSRIYTSDYVLDEVVTLLCRRVRFDEMVQFVEGIFSAADQALLTIEPITSARFTEAWLLRHRFHDKPRISFTDLTSMVVMKELGIPDVLTEDDHFVQVGMSFRKVP